MLLRSGRRSVRQRSAAHLWRRRRARTGTGTACATTGTAAPTRSAALIAGEAIGHTDSIGTEDYNLDLSRRRAESAVNYLAAQGVTESRITVRGMGESEPVADNATAEGRALNRRVVLRRLDCAQARPGGAQ